MHTSDENRLQASAPSERCLVSTGEYEAWLFDLDGVITDTASVHAAWKRAFDRYLREVSEREGRSFAADLFDARVGGNVAEKKRLAGMPAPDTFEEAARMLGAPPERAVVAEDSVSGVRAGNVRLVVGVARGDDPEVHQQRCADVVVRDLAQIGVE